MSVIKIKKIIFLSLLACSINLKAKAEVNTWSFGVKAGVSNSGILADTDAMRDVLIKKSRENRTGHVHIKQFGRTFFNPGFSGGIWAQYAGKPIFWIGGRYFILPTKRNLGIGNETGEKSGYITEYITKQRT